MRTQNERGCLHGSAKTTARHAERRLCRQRTRGRLSLLLWAALCLFIGAALAVFFFGTWMESGDQREMESYVRLAVSGVLGPAAVLGGFYLVYVGIRDAFFRKKVRWPSPSAPSSLSLMRPRPWVSCSPWWTAIFVTTDSGLITSPWAASGKPWTGTTGAARPNGHPNGSGADSSSSSAAPADYGPRKRCLPREAGAFHCAFAVPRRFAFVSPTYGEICVLTSQCRRDRLYKN